MTTTTIAVPRDVPDGYALVKHEAIEYLADQWPGAYQKFYAIAVDSAPSAPTVKAEQWSDGDNIKHLADCDVSGCGRCENLMYFYQACDECGAWGHNDAGACACLKKSTSLPADSDLTASQCACGDEYPANSYGAGFIAGSGMCQVCDAAIPAVDLPSAAPAEQPYPHGIAEDLERSDWAPLEALQWYAAGKHFDVADGRTRIIDTGAVASNALKHASLAYLELKGDAELSELRAALSAHQSAHVSVPREWLDAVKELFDAKQAKEDFERENPGNSTKRWDACLYRIEAAEDALRALLNGGEA